MVIPSKGKSQSDFYTQFKNDLISVTLSGTATLNNVQEIVELNSSGGAFTVTLPDATDMKTNKRVWFYDNGSAGSNNITIVTNPADSTQFFSGSSFVINQNNQAAIFELVGGIWMVLTNTTFNDNMMDAFGRLRVSMPATIFDSKQINDNQPLYWDDQETSGSGTGSSYSQDTASTDMTVSASTAGTRVRQTFRRFNYQPGKSQLVFMTGILGSGESGLTQRIGYFDGNNGLFFQVDDGTLSVVRRTFVTGSAVDNVVTQANFSLDKLDGTGASGITIDLDKTQIFVMDFEWLGVGRVRMGVDIDGVLIYCHEFHNANVLDQVYISTPNLPLRYEISNDGTAGAATLKHICSSVMSESGVEPVGTLFTHSNGDTNIDANSSGTAYALLGFKFQAGKEQTDIELEKISVLAENNDDLEWFTVLNPTLGTPLVYSNHPNSALQVAVGEGSNPSLSTVTGGTMISGGYSEGNAAFTNNLGNALKLGSAIDGTSDELILACRPLSNGLNVYGSITWREL